MFINRNVSKLAGIEPESLVEQPMDALFSTPSRIFLQTHIWPMLMRQGHINEIRLHLLHTSGNQIPVYLNCQRSMVSSDEQYVWVCFVAMERVHFEKQLLEARQRADAVSAQNLKKLENTLTILHQSREQLAISESKAMLSTLIASVSHELNAPIGNTILAATTMNDTLNQLQQAMDEGQLKRQMLLTMIGELKSCATLIERNADRADQLLTSFRHVAADQASEQRRQFDVANVVTEILSTIAPSLKRYTHRVDMNIPSGIVMDSLPGPLGQVLINLINNAYLHAFDERNDGIVTIDATTIDDQVVINVADNGVGIPEAHLQQLFKEFFSTKIGKGGTGLGMAIVRNLVTKTLKGSLNVASEVGVGTRFEITLPLVLPHN